jgi:hypothetical protein
MSPSFLINYPLFPIPHSRNFGPPDLLLQLEHAIQQSFTGWGAAWDIDADRYNSVDAPYNTVAVVVVTSTVCTAAHADYPLRIRHLIVTLPNGWCHFVRHSPGDNHNVGLTRRSTEDDAQAVLVVSRHWGMHHLDAAACQAKWERPHRSIPCPAHNFIQVGTIINCSQPLCSISAADIHLALQDMFHQTCRFDLAW